MNTQTQISMDSLEARTMFSAAVPAVVGYLPDYEVANVQNANTGKLDGVDWKSLTEVNYFSIVPNADGSLPTKTSSGGSLDQLDEVVKEAHRNGVKVNIVIGGAGLDDNLFAMSNDWSTWDPFAANLQTFAKNHNVDGIDLDLEKSHPTEEQIGNYGDMIATLRSDLPSSLTLSAAVYATPLSIATDLNPSGNAYKTFDWQLNQTAINNLDRIGVMDYDLDYADHAALQASEDNMTAWANHVGSNNTGKLLFGLPFYGKAGSSWDVNDEQSYATLADTYLAHHSKLPTTDKITAAYDGKLDGGNQDWYYNGQATIAAKTQFAIDKHYAGVMAWDLGQDHVSGTNNTANHTDTLSLLGTIGSTMRSNGYLTATRAPIATGVFSNTPTDQVASIGNDVLTQL